MDDNDECLPECLSLTALLSGVLPYLNTKRRPRNGCNGAFSHYGCLVMEFDTLISVDI